MHVCWPPWQRCELTASANQASSLGILVPGLWYPHLGYHARWDSAGGCSSGPSSCLPRAPVAVAGGGGGSSAPRASWLQLCPGAAPTPGSPACHKRPLPAVRCRAHAGGLTPPLATRAPPPAPSLWLCPSPCSAPSRAQPHCLLCSPCPGGMPGPREQSCTRFHAQLLAYICSLSDLPPKPCRNLNATPLQHGPAPK